VHVRVQYGGLRCKCTVYHCAFLCVPVHIFVETCLFKEDSGHARTNRRILRASTPSSRLFLAIQARTHVRDETCFSLKFCLVLIFESYTYTYVLPTLAIIKQIKFSCRLHLIQLGFCVIDALKVIFRSCQKKTIFQNHKVPLTLES